METGNAGAHIESKMRDVNVYAEMEIRDNSASLQGHKAGEGMVGLNQQNHNDVVAASRKM